MKKETFEDAIPQPQTLWFKLHKAKQQIGKVGKNAKNPHFKKTYSDINALIEAVEPILLEFNLILLQPIEDGKVITRIICAETGQAVQSEMTLPVITDPQKVGSAVTYFRRYTLQSLMALQSEDDDANSASEAVKNTKPPMSAERFENGLSKVDSGEMTKDAFKLALSKFQLTESQAQVIAML